jgi:hypothetical protein
MPTIMRQYYASVPVSLVSLCQKLEFVKCARLLYCNLNAIKESYFMQLELNNTVFHRLHRPSNKTQTCNDCWLFSHFSNLFVPLRQYRMTDASRRAITLISANGNRCMLNSNGVKYYFNIAFKKQQNKIASS